MTIPSSAGKEKNKPLPYGRFKLAVKYINYLLAASNGKGHGIHSPFAFDFIRNVLMADGNQNINVEINSLRKKLLTDPTVVEVEDLGAGSASKLSKKRSVASIAATSLKSPKYARVLQNMVAHYKPASILELGTSLGITSAMMAKANKEAQVFTIEGSGAIASVAENNFCRLHQENVRIFRGDFDDQLGAVLNQMKKVDLAFIDGNHRYQPTLNYFEKILPFLSSYSFVVFDDIHWSPEMEEAWSELKRHPAVGLSIDLFFLGILVMSPDFKVPGHFVIRY